VGDRRAHENPALLSLSIMFMRYHNALAQEYAAEAVSAGSPEPTDKELFRRARTQTIAVLQVKTRDYKDLILFDSYVYVRQNSTLKSELMAIIRWIKFNLIFLIVYF